MPNVFNLLEICAECYSKPSIVAGLDGRNAASVSTLPSGEIVLCFRGTLTNGDFASALDWLGDFNAELVPDDGFSGRVHKGFLDALNSLWASVFDALESPNGPEAKVLPPADERTPWWKRLLNTTSYDTMFVPMPEIASTPLPWEKKLWITGHSKGGALAQLAGVRLQALKPRVVTFASPLVGDAQFAAAWPEKVALTRYEGDYDLVPHLPPYLFGYHAAGQVVRQGVIPAPMREAAINRLIATGQWARIHEAHSLATGYAPWVGGKPTPPQAAQTVAA